MQPYVKRLIYLSMVFAAGLISAYDNVLSYLLMDSLEANEKNPMALWVIQNGGVASLIYLKAVGTITACLIMIRLVYCKWRITIIPVFVVQVMLFCYLSFYTGRGFDLFVPDAWETIRMVLEFYAK